MPRKKPKLKMTSPANNQQVPLGTTLTIEVEISDTNVPDDGVGLFFTDLAKLAKPVYELKFSRTAAKNVSKISFPHRPTNRGEHRIRCLGWFRATGLNANSPNSPSHNDKNVADEGVKITVT
jgi:hypothetical protein